MGKQEQDKAGDAGKKNAADGEKKEKPIAVVLKIEMDCSCVSKICTSLCSLPGVETVTVDLPQNKVTVNGIIDPLMIKDKLQSGMKKKVQVISPLPKEPPVTTTVLKLSFHCRGCTEKIRKLISRTIGVHDFNMDDQKDQVTVKGTMDVKSLMEKLNKKLKRAVEIVPPPKKEKEKDQGAENGSAGNGRKKKKKGDGVPPKEEEKGQGGENEGGGGNGKKKKKKKQEEECRGGGQSGGGAGGGCGYLQDPAYPVALEHAPAPQLFSDENPHACAVM